MFVETLRGFRLFVGRVKILEHTAEAPAVFVGRGDARVKMLRGNFELRDCLTERIALGVIDVSENSVVLGSPAVAGAVTLRCREENGVCFLDAECADGSVNRLWIRFRSHAGERFTGGGEQFSCLDLKGRLFPVWTREQGVGRNKLTEITRLSDELDGSGGDYHTTFFPQATFVSSGKYFVHLFNTEYAELDFREETFTEVSVWSRSASFAFGAAESYEALLTLLTGLTGRQPALPDWAMQGLWLGVQGGTERAVELRDRCADAGVNVSAVWIQDWEGTRQTSFGKRNFWDWRHSEKLYPGLKEVIAQDSGRAWMGYINPYIVKEGQLCREAIQKGYLVKNKDGEDYLFDFGEFDCGVVDLTMPEAYEWYKGVIKHNLIDFGLRGWMADFGEYLPADAVCCGGDGMRLHNLWPTLWAKCNREAVEESGKLGDIVFYMRAGGAGTQRYSTLMWAGDQNVDWSEDDGLPSVVTSALTLGMSGFGLHCSDAGGYTTLFHMRRTEELMMRWLEFAAFTPVMRSHEGNRPATNVQLYDTPELLAFTAETVRIHDALLPYMRSLVRENEASGVPVMRPLFFAEDCPEAWDRDNFAYMLGSDAVVAPVVRQGDTRRTLWLPEGDWTHLWSGERFSGGRVTVDAPLGKIPVFYKANSDFAAVFRDIAAL